MYVRVRVCVSISHIWGRLHGFQSLKGAVCPKKTWPGLGSPFVSSAAPLLSQCPRPLALAWNPAAFKLVSQGLSLPPWAARKTFRMASDWASPAFHHQDPNGLDFAAILGSLPTTNSQESNLKSPALRSVSSSLWWGKSLLEISH